MNTCPNCRELNGTGRDTCWKCGADLKPLFGEARRLEKTYQKICPKCKRMYPREAERCETCGAALGVYSPEANEMAKQAERSRGKSRYLICFLFPPLGVYHELKAALDDDLAEKTLIGIATGAGVLLWALLILGICWIAGAFSPSPTASEADAALESFFAASRRWMI